MSPLVKLMIASVMIYLSVVVIALNLLSQDLDLSVNQILSHSFPQKGHDMKYAASKPSPSSDLKSSSDQVISTYNQPTQSVSTLTFSHYLDLANEEYMTFRISFPQTLELKTHLKNKLR